CQQVIEGHRLRVNAVSFSPDSSLIASTSRDNTVRICQVDTGECIRELEADMVKVQNVKFSPDSSLIAFACLNGVVQLCRGDTGDRIKTFQTCSPNYSGEFQFSSDSKLLAFISRRETLRVLHLDTLECVQDIKPGDFLLSFAFIGDSSLMVAGTRSEDDRIIQIRWVDSNQVIQSLKGHEITVHGAEFSPDCRILGSFSQDDSVRTWRVATGECLHVFNGHSSFPTTMSFSPDMSLIASGAHDSTVRIWRIDSDDDSHQQSENHDSIGSVVVSPDRTLVASYSARGKVRVWKMDTGECLHPNLKHGDERIGSLAFYSNSKLICARSWNSETLWLWRVDTGQCIRKLRIDGSQHVSFSPNGKWITLIQNKNRLLFLGGDTLHCKHRFKASGPILKQVYSSDSTLVAALSYPADDGSGNLDLNVWSVDTGRQIWTIKGLGGNAGTLAVSPDSKLVAA
ncbi:quinon protein alcohol dehydrogenase-like superfamily, partial [Ilyonectria robusta]|uniref:quinon protein alcohol dehydrogenase-like superfamily n=1 Tax=Ilyonectria robusta TaxID=1079257 RepID=UPI001E8E7DB1